MRQRAIILGLAVGALVLAACGRSGGDDGTSTTAPLTRAATQPSAATSIPAATQPPTLAPGATSTLPTGNTNPLSATVGVESPSVFIWSPAQVTIAPGGTVNFLWKDSTEGHDISIPALGVFTAPSRRDSQTVSFPDRGSYPFVCTYHPDTMRGIVTVQ